METMNIQTREGKIELQKGNIKHFKRARSEKPGMPKSLNIRTGGEGEPGDVHIQVRPLALQ